MNPQWSEILNHPVDALALVDPIDHTIISCNGNFEKYFRDSFGSLLKRNLFDLKEFRVPHEKQRLIQLQLNEIGIHQFHNNETGNLVLITALKFPGNPLWLIRVSLNEYSWQGQHYRILLDKNVAGIFQGYIGGKLIATNDAFAHILGYNSSEELLNANTYNFYPTPADRDKFIEDLRNKGPLINYEIKLKKVSGEIITCIENTYLNVEPDGRELISGTLIDITHLKKVEADLAESENRFKILSSVAHEGVVFLDDFEIADCNDQFIEIFSMDNQKEAIGADIRQFISEFSLERILEGAALSSTNRYEEIAADKNGKSLYLEISGGITQLKGNNRRVLVFNDITARKRSENALEQSVVRLRNLLEHSPNAVLILIEGRIRYANHAALELFGFKFEDELFDREFLRFVNSPYRKEIREDFRAIRNGQEREYKEIKIIDHNGIDLDVGIKAALTVYENKPALQIAIVNISERTQLVQEQMRIRIIEEINTVLKQEIEEHKLTQQKLVAQQKYTKRIIDSSLDMIMASNGEGLIIEFNPAAELQFGYRRDEVIGKPARILFANHKDNDRVTSEMIETGSFSGEVINLHKNGSVFTSVLSASIIRDEEGNNIGSMGISRDITQIREIELQAREQRAKLESIFNSTMNMMMWTMNRNFEITTVNVNFSQWTFQELDERIQLGTDIREILERHMDENLDQGQLESFDYAFKGRAQQFEFPVKNREGRTLWLQAFLNPVNIGEHLEEISCLVYDNTERREIDKKIRESLKEKEVLLQEIHHRVKNNLQVISSILNLQSSYVTDERTLDILKESQNRIKSMSFIHETLYRTNDFSSIDFSEYIRIIAFNLVQTYRTNDCIIHLEPNFEQVFIHLDQAIPCGLIINELVSNATKYAFKGRKEGKIEMELTKKHNRISLRVADDGVGLPDNFHFEKTDSLGIQLVYTLIEQLDGKIEVKTGGWGTEFLFTFDAL